jgi:hypothetical protein
LQITDGGAEGGNLFIIQWSSVTGKNYAVSRSTDGADTWSPLRQGIQAEPPYNTYTDTMPFVSHALYHVTVDDE